ncbi:MAG: Plug domain-containing protein, partial [Pseudomonadales bacterium]|nr:Plug domain-containing protein [Pseudomonadales bacterium]
MTRIKKCWCSVVLVGLISSSAQGAHVEVKEALLSLSLQELMELEITSSTLTAKNVKSVPASVSVFTKEQFMRMGADYLHELINFVPGFQSFRQGENSVQHYYSARGHRSSTASREVLILIDGMRMNREFDNVFSVPMLSLHNVEKIEFIRGPGSAIYGSNAFMGVINITTQKNQNRIHTAFG